MTTQAQDMRGTESLALRPREAAQALGISPKTLQRWTNSGQIQCVRKGRIVVYSVKTLNEWLASNETGKHSGTATTI